MVNFKNFSLKLFCVLFITTIFIFISAKSYSQTMFNNISSNFLRLHIVANSDSTEDQMLKYEIRDEIIKYISPFFSDIKDKNDAKKILSNHISDFYKICYKVVYTHGYDYSVNISIGNFYFPTKEYNNFTLPEGLYDALKIEIGDAKGQNWWCVMFPSLCIIDNSNLQFTDNSEEILKNNLGSEEYSIITNQNESPNIKIKFKLIEFFENI